MSKQEDNVASPEMEEYFENLYKKTKIEKTLADSAREKGYDPETFVEIKLAKNMAERVVGLISSVAPQLVGTKAVDRIIELEEEYGAQNWRVALKIAEEIAKETFCRFKDKKEAMEVGIRMGFAYVTVGVVSSPLEGFTEIIIKKRNDNGKEYFCLNFSGPIRNAGGTAASVCVLIADYIRKKMGFAQWDPTEEEIKRSYTEVYDYHERVTNLQYNPSKDELEFLIKNMPLEISGDPTEELEVSNFKDIPRTQTNRIRGGMCLIYSSCIPLKAPKLWKQLSKWGNEMDMEQWNFIDEFVHIQKEMKSKGKKSDDGGEKIKPDYTFIADLVAGRPVFGHPLKGFRLRYGRSRLSGYSAQGINPATMHIMNDFIATGTQLKVERPGKAAAYTPCDSIEGPIVRLIDGSVIKVNSESLALKVKDRVEKILYNGDILINYGDFFNRAHVLTPPGYCEEWWVLELKKAYKNKPKLVDLLFEKMKISKEDFEKMLSNPFKFKPSVYLSFAISSIFKIPLHPKYTLFWKMITRDQLLRFVDWIFTAKLVKENGKISRLALKKSEDKEILELLGLEHSVYNNEFFLIEKEWAYLLIKTFSMGKQKVEDVIKLMNDNPSLDVLSLISKMSGIKIRDKVGIFIGARMGRPEKAKMRKLQGSPQVLFPVGEEGGKYRSFQSALEKGKIESDFPIFICDSCGKETVFSICEDCGSKTSRKYMCSECGVIDAPECQNGHKEPDRQRVLPYTRKSVKIRELFNKMLKQLDTKIYPDLIKGVRGTSNKDHTPEYLLKGILRAKHNIFVNKDGTVRYDSSEIPITHFNSREIGASIEKLKELGYKKDIYGKELVSDEQVIEIMPQDIVIPCCPNSTEDPADEVLLRVTKFIDEMLVKLYGLKPYYNCKTREDLIGQLVVGLAPHTSAGILTRVIGFSKTQGFFAHPMIHAAMRRDTDGDESCFFLLLDGFLNFSKRYLPGSRGSTMDAPLVLTTKLIPSEVDDMVFDMDIAWKYPLEFYQACLEYKMPWDIKINQLNNNLDTPLQYEGYGYTHPTTTMNAGITCSSYKTLPSMQEKLENQMDLAIKLSSVDEVDVAKLVIDKHFIKDLKGNLRKFSMQQFRCVACNEKFRRPPLSGRCTHCRGKIIFTISEGSVGKYLEPSLSLAKRFEVNEFLKQTLDLTKESFESIFGCDKEVQSSLGKWFG
jgi:DNA polymerase II large subunit